MADQSGTPNGNGNHAQELNVSQEMKKGDFRVAIFGSARIKPGDEMYQRVFDLAKGVAERGHDVITGGGPGLMEAGNKGHEAGDPEGRSESIGLNIKLPFEQHANEYVEFVKDFEKFSDRLDTFMQLSHVFVVTPGGIGTMLEFFFTWQLLQVKKMGYKPIILVGEMWEKLVDWIIDYALRDGLLSASDFDYVYIARNNEEALAYIDQFYDQCHGKGDCRPLPQKLSPEEMKERREAGKKKNAE